MENLLHTWRGRGVLRWCRRDGGRKQRKWEERVNEGLRVSMNESFARRVLRIVSRSAQSEGGGGVKEKRML